MSQKLFFLRVRSNLKVTILNKTLLKEKVSDPCIANILFYLLYRVEHFI